MTEQHEQKRLPQPEAKRTDCEPIRRADGAGNIKQKGMREGRKGDSGSGYAWAATGIVLLRLIQQLLALFVYDRERKLALGVMSANLLGFSFG